MTILTKIGVGLFTLGSISTAGYFGGTYLFAGTLIKDLIEKEYEYILLKTEGTEDNTSWDTIWTKYKNDNSQKDEDIFKLEGWTKVGTKDLKDKLKLKCKELVTRSVYENKDVSYKQTTSYCARRVSIKDEAIKKGFRIIDTNTADATVWNAREREKENLKTQLAKLGAKEQTLNADKIKEICKEAQTKTKEERDYSLIFEAYNNVCVKKAGEN